MPLNLLEVHGQWYKRQRHHIFFGDIKRNALMAFDLYTTFIVI